jgi:hypothetical protein
MQNAKLPKYTSKFLSLSTDTSILSTRNVESFYAHKKTSRIRIVNNLFNNPDMPLLAFEA